MHKITLVVLFLFSGPLVAMDEPPVKKQKTGTINLTKKQIASLKLIKAARANNYPKVGSALAQGANPNARDDGGLTPLHYAARNGATEIVKLLLGMHASVTIQDQTGLSPLHCAVKKGHEKLAALLLEAQAHVDSTDQWSRTPLNLAVKKGLVRIIELLLNYNANPDIQDDSLYSPLHTAINCNHRDAVRLLLTAKPKLNVRNDHGIVPLTLAVHQGQVDIVRVLIEAGAPVDTFNFQSDTPLYESIQNGDTQIAELLLMAGADYTVPGDREIKENEDENDSEDEEGFKKNFVYTDAGFTCLHRAASQGYDHLVKLLLALGADPEVKDKDGYTAYEGGITPKTVLVFTQFKQLQESVSLDSLFEAVNQGYADLVVKFLTKLIVSQTTIRALGAIAQQQFTATQNKLYKVIGLMLKERFLKQAQYMSILKDATPLDIQGNALTHRELPYDIAVIIAYYVG